MKVAVLGNSYWAGRLVAVLNGMAVNARQFYIGDDKSLPARSIKEWVSESDLWSCDLVHVLGWPMLWILWIASRLKNKPTIVHWIGSDVLSLLASPRWSRAAGPILNAVVTRHLAVAPHLVSELRSVGIYAKHHPQGMPSFENVTVPPLPLAPCALAMLRPDRFEFYGGVDVLQMARASPNIRWLIIAHDGKDLPHLPNVEYLGHVDDMDTIYQQVTVLVRLTKHDGLPIMMLEALARGRHVVWSYPMPFCRLARTAESALREVRAAIASQSLNLEGAAYVRKEYDVEKHTRRLCKIYAALTGS